MISYDELISKHYILQRKRINPFEATEPFHPFEGFGLECGAGWYDLLDDLCTKIEKELKKIKNDKEEYPFQIDQVKEKFGTLRFYVSSATDRIYEFIDEAENKSETTCEVCGEPGKTLCIRRWLTTLCPKHAAKGLDKWKKSIIENMSSTEQTINIFLAKKVRTAEENTELIEAQEWFKIGNENLIEINETKKGLFK